MEYLFEVTAERLRGLPRDAALLQTRHALEQRTELRSRELLPGLWKVTNKLRIIPKAEESLLQKRRRRTKMLSVICLVLGGSALVPGMAAPRDPILILAGAVGIFFGLFRLYGTQKPGKRFQIPAKTLLNKLFTFTGHTAVRITFSDAGMVLEEIHAGMPENRRPIPYPSFECIIECSDLYLLAYSGNGLILPKCCQISGTPEQLRAALSPKTCYLLL